VSPSDEVPEAVPSVAQVEANLSAVHAKIREAGGDPSTVRVVAVTKGFAPSLASVARAAGLRDLGENYAQELVAKVDALRDHDGSPAFGGDGDGDGGLVWHFLGRLQTNKVRAIADLVGLWQSVDRAALIQQIARRAPRAAILVQINLAGESQKGGCAFADVAPLVGQARDAGLDVRGLMGVAPAGRPDEARPGFRRLVSLADELGLVERSIGMSNDYTVAVEEGSTMVRIGRGLFGPRPRTDTP